MRGTPNTQPDPIKVGATLEKTLQDDLPAEQEATKPYKEIIAIAKKEEDQLSRRLFERVLAQEGEHADTLATFSEKQGSFWCRVSEPPQGSSTADASASLIR